MRGPGRRREVRRGEGERRGCEEGNGERRKEEPQVAGRPVEGSVLETKGKKGEAYDVQCCWVVEWTRAWLLDWSI